MTEKPFGDFKLHLEFNVPYMPKARGQGRGNSGVYLGGIYELQVLDSYGLKSKNNDCGAIYTQIVPSVNACKPPLQWQTYDVTFHKAVVDGEGKVVKKARVTVIHNGIKTIDDAEIGTTPGGAGNHRRRRTGRSCSRITGTPSSIAISGFSRSALGQSHPFGRARLRPSLLRMPARTEPRPPEIPSGLTPRPPS